MEGCVSGFDCMLDDALADRQREKHSKDLIHHHCYHFHLLAPADTIGVLQVGQLIQEYSNFSHGCDGEDSKKREEGRSKLCPWWFLFVVFMLCS